jgi:hypothetical protein
MRARAFCLRDAYADVLKGFKVMEEVQEYTNMGPDYAIDVTPRPEPTPEPEVEHEEFGLIYDCEGNSVELMQTPLEWSSKAQEILTNANEVDISNFCDHNGDQLYEIQQKHPEIYSKISPVFDVEEDNQNTLDV